MQATPEKEKLMTREELINSAVFKKCLTQKETERVNEMNGLSARRKSRSPHFVRTYQHKQSQMQLDMKRYNKLSALRPRRN